MCMYIVARAQFDFLVSNPVAGFSVSVSTAVSFSSLPFSTSLSLLTLISTNVPNFLVFVLCVSEHLPQPFYLFLDYLLITCRVNLVLFLT